MPAVPVSSSVPLTGNPYIDGLTYGARWTFPEGDRVLRWALIDTAGTALSDAQRGSFRDLFAGIEPFIDVRFQEMPGGRGLASVLTADADIAVFWGGQAALDVTRLVNGQNIGVFPSPNYVDTSFAAAARQGLETTFSRTTYRRPEGDLFISETTTSPLSATNGSLAFLLHEVGHALGLKHTFAFEGDPGVSRPSFYDVGLGTRDSTGYSLMSYTNDLSLPYAATYAVYDVAALQYLYGPNNRHQAGDSVYALNQALPASHVLWDAGGIDTVSIADSTIVGDIDLRPGQMSRIGSIVYTVAFGVVIENAAGGAGADTIIGNAAANILTGGGGNDRLTGGAGVDTAVFSGGRNQYTITTVDGVTTVTHTANNGDGVDTLVGIERLRFTDGQVPIGRAAQELVLNNSGRVLTYDATPGAERLNFLADFGAGAAAVLAADFSGDERPDLLLRSSGGDYLIWQPTAPDRFVLTPDFAGAQPITVGRFTGAGAADVVLLDSASGALRFYSPWWNQITDFLTLQTGIDLVGSGDFNADGRSDLLFHDRRSGVVFNWVNGDDFHPLITLLPEWSVAAVGNFNGDQQNDLLLRDDLSGRLVFFFPSSASERFVEFITPQAGWRVSGAADVDGDGLDDVLLANNELQLGLAWDGQQFLTLGPVGNAVLGGAADFG